MKQTFHSAYMTVSIIHHKNSTITPKQSKNTKPCTKCTKPKCSLGLLHITTNNTITPTCIGLTEIFTTPTNIHLPLDGYHTIEKNTRKEKD